MVVNIQAKLDALPAEIEWATVCEYRSPVVKGHSKEVWARKALEHHFYWKWAKKAHDNGIINAIMNGDDYHEYDAEGNDTGRYRHAWRVRGGVMYRRNGRGTWYLVVTVPYGGTHADCPWYADKFKGLVNHGPNPHERLDYDKATGHFKPRYKKFPWLPFRYDLDMIDKYGIDGVDDTTGIIRGTVLQTPAYGYTGTTPEDSDGQ